MHSTTGGNPLQGHDYARELKRLWNLLFLWARPSPVVGATPADVVHRENKWRLLRYRSRSQGVAFETPILIVPSLINRHYVLDLQPGKSFAEHLVAEGHDVYIIDWGRPGDEDRYLTFDEVCDRYLGRAVRCAARASMRGKAHLLGYCMGGTMTAIYAAARPTHVASLVTIGAPVRFHDDGLLSAWSRTRTFDVGTLVKALGNAPGLLLQSSFQWLRPTLILSKSVHLVNRAWEDEYLDGFFALEAWGNDNVPFPGECYRQFIEEISRPDALVRGTFSLSGDPVRLEAIHCPTLAITFEHDRIVPWRSGAELVDRVASVDKESVLLPGGHVGAVISRHASRTLWPRISAWLGARDQERAAGQ